MARIIQKSITQSSSQDQLTVQQTTQQEIVKELDWSLVSDKEIYLIEPSKIISIKTAILKNQEILLNNQGNFSRD